MTPRGRVNKQVKLEHTDHMLKINVKEKQQQKTTKNKQTKKKTASSSAIYMLIIVQMLKQHPIAFLCEEHHENIPI